MAHPTAAAHPTATPAATPAAPAAAAPTTTAAHPNLHQIPLIKNPNFVRDGLKAYGHMLRKYGFNPTIEGPFIMAEEIIQEGEHHFFRKWLNKPDHIHTRNRLCKRNDSGQKGDVTAQDVQNGREYLGQVGIGSPTQYFNLDFDTGSSDLWVWSTSLSKKHLACTKHNVYDNTKSCTAKLVSGATWKIGYGDGSSANGIVYEDTINVGGLPIKCQGIEAACEFSQAFEDDTSDGLLGLAFPSLNTVKPTAEATPVQNMATQAVVDKDNQVFTAYLTNGKDNIAPCYTFGYIDQQLLNGKPIHWTPVDSSQGFWQIASTSAVVNGCTVPIASGTAVMDTGTSLALVDDHTCSAIYAAIPGAKQDKTVGGWVFPASVTEAELPCISFDIGGQQCALHKEDLIYAAAGNGMIYGGIQSRGSLPFSLYGDSILKSMYAIFHEGNKSFGFVERSILSPDPSTQARAIQPAAAPTVSAAPVPGTVAPAAGPPAPAPAAAPAAPAPVTPAPALVTPAPAPVGPAPVAPAPAPAAPAPAPAAAHPAADPAPPAADPPAAAPPAS